MMKQPNTFTNKRAAFNILQSFWLVAATGFGALFPQLIAAQPTWQVQSDYFGERNAIAQPRTTRGLALSQDGQSVYTGLIQSPNVGTTSLRKVSSDVLAVPGTDHVIFGNGMPGGTGGFGQVGGQPVYAGGATGTFEGWIDVGNSPEAIATDDRGYVYTALSSGITNANRVDIFNSGLTAQVGTIASTSPTGVHVHKIGSVYYAYVVSGNGLQRFDVTNVNAPVLDAGYTPGILLGTNVTVDADGTVFVAGNNQVRRISAAGVLTHTVTLTSAQDVAVYNDKLYVVKLGSPTQSITVLNKADLTSGGADLVVPDFGTTRSTISQFRAIDVNAQGQLYVSEENYNGTNAGCGGCITSYTPPVTSFNPAPGPITGRVYFDRVVLSSPLDPLTLGATTPTNVQCGQTTGSIEVTISGGSAPYDYNWDNGTTTGSGPDAFPTAGPNTISNLVAGTYTITITDAMGSTATTGATILPPSGCPEACPTVAFDIAGNSVASTNNGAADPSESATVEVCDGGTYGISNLVHSSPTNRYSIGVTPSGGGLLFDGSPAGNADISAAQFDGAQGAHTITLSDPTTGGTLMQVITPYNDVNNNNTYDAGVDCAGDPVTITYTAHPTPLLETSINSVVVTSNNDSADDAGAFSVCNTPNNFVVDYFTDLNGLTPAASVKAFQTFTTNNVTVPFCNNCAAPLSAFAGTTGTVALVDPSLPGTLEISFRAFLDENNNNVIDADECSGDLVTYIVTVNPDQVVTCPANQTVCENAPAYALTGESPAGGTYSGTGVNVGMFDPAVAGPGTYPVTYSFSDGNNCTSTCTFMITVNPEPTFTFTATTTGGSTGTANTNGGANTVDLYFCPGESFSFNNYSSNPGSQVGYLEEIPAGTNNVTYNGGAVTAPRAQQDFGPSMAAGLFGGPFGPYGLSSGTSGSLTQTYTPYYDADNSNSYTTGDCLGEPITINYYINTPAQLQTTVNSVQVTSNNDGVDDTGAFSVCNSAGNNLFFTQFADIAGVTPAEQVKVEQQFTLTNVTFGPPNGTFPLSAYGTPFDRNVSLVDPTLPGTLVMRFRTFNDNNNNNVLDAGECAGDWIVYTVTVDPVEVVTCPANQSVCEDTPAYALTGETPAGGTYSGTGVSGGMFDPAAAGPGTYTITYTASGCSTPCTFTITVNEAPTVSFDIAGSSVTTNNDGVADPAESATVEVCDGGTYTVSNLVHSSASNRYSITVTPSGGGLLFDGSPAGNGDISAAQFDGAQGAHTITLSNPNMGGSLVQVITPYNDVNNNGTFDAGDCAGDPVTITYTAHPTPLLETSINSVVVTSNNDSADDVEAFSVCNTPNNIGFDYFTDLHGLTPASSVKAYQTFTATNVTVPFCNNCAASLSAFAGTTGTAALVDPSLPGTLEISFRAFLDENNNNVIDADECAGDLVTYTITVSPAPTFGFTATTTGGSTGTANTNGGATTVDLYFCPGESFSFSGYSSIPGSQVGYLEEIPTGTNNVTYNGGAVTVPRAQQDFGPSMAAGLFGGPFGPYNLSSGTSGSLTQTYTPYYDADNSNSYTAGDCLGAPVTVNYYINAPAQLQTTVNGVQVTSNNNGVDDTGTFSVCNATSNNLSFTQFTDLAGVTPAALVKVQQQFTLTNVIFTPPNGTFPLSAYTTPFNRNVSLVNTALPGTLVMRFRTFNDLNNNNLLDAGECAGDWIVYTVTVTQCCAAPVFTACPTNQTVNAAPNMCSAIVNYTATATGTPAPTYSYTFNGGPSNPGTGSGSTFSKGVTNVVVTATNSCGPTTCSFTVTVNDTQQPGITCPANIVRGTDPGLCSAVVNYTTPTYTDNCSGASVAIVPPSLASGSAFPKGLNSVVWQVTDGAGLTKRCTFTVTVNDNQAPVITCPANQSKNTDPSLCSAVVTYTTPTFTDNCPGGSVALVSGMSSGGTFPKGITTVQWRATDAAGLTKTCTFRVTVNDTQAPTIACPANQVKNTDPGQCTAVATFANATFTDNCPGGSVTQMSGLTSGSAFPKGLNMVKFKATDAAGNFTICTMTITVNDAQPPTIVCPPNMVVTGDRSTGICKSRVVYPNPTTNDNCSGVTSYLLSGLASYSDFPEGVTTNVWRAVDGAGASTTCSFTVTVNCPAAAQPATANQGIQEADDTRSTADRDAELQAVNNNLLTLALAPNPASTEVLISIDGLSEKGGLLTIFDAAGRMVWQQQVEAQQTTIMLDVAEKSFVGGVYFVTLRSEGATATKRLMVNKL